MTDSYKKYHETFTKEMTALIDLFGKVMSGSIAKEEIERQAHQHFDNLDNSAAEYHEDLEKQGRILELPCALGDTIYYLTGTPNSLGNGKFDRVEESKAVGFHVDRNGLSVRLDYNWKGIHGTYGFFDKTVFRTREEAENALKEL